MALLAAFPLAFAIIMPAVYFPILIMLLALVFRGVAFEFRFRDAEHRTFWDHAFCYGSALGAFAQGVVLGAFIQGFAVDGRHFAGHSLDCFTPFSVLTGVALMFGYALLGAGWLVLKTEGEAAGDGAPARALRLHRRSRRRRRGKPVDALHQPGDRRTLVLMAEPRLSRARAGRDGAGCGGRMAGAERPVGGAPFVWAVVLFVMSYLGIAISLFPYIVPYKYTIWDAASSEATQAFLLIGALALLPIVLIYSGWSYWVFRGKVRADIGYH